MVRQCTSKFIDFRSADGTLSSLYLNDFSDFGNSKLNPGNDVHSFVAANLRYVDILIVHLVQKLFDKMLELGRFQSH